MKLAINVVAFVALSALGGGLWVAAGYAAGLAAAAVFGRG